MFNKKTLKVDPSLLWEKVVAKSLSITAEVMEGMALRAQNRAAPESWRV